jgi:hypothetical protein
LFANGGLKELCPLKKLFSLLVGMFEGAKSLQRILLPFPLLRGRG